MCPTVPADVKERSELARLSIRVEKLQIEERLADDHVEEEMSHFPADRLRPIMHGNDHVSQNRKFTTHRLPKMTLCRELISEGGEGGGG